MSISVTTIQLTKLLWLVFAFIKQTTETELIEAVVVVESSQQNHSYAHNQIVAQQQQQHHHHLQQYSNTGSDPNWCESYSSSSPFLTHDSLSKTYHFGTNFHLNNHQQHQNNNNNSGTYKWQNRSNSQNNQWNSLQSNAPFVDNFQQQQQRQQQFIPSSSNGLERQIVTPFNSLSSSEHQNCPHVNVDEHKLYSSLPTSSLTNFYQQ